MKRILCALILMTAVLTVGVDTPATAATKPCSRGDAEAMARSGIQFGGRYLGGQPHGAPAASAHRWEDCQFRLYDDNDQDDPEVPHIFSDQDTFLAGIFYFLFDFEIDEFFGGDRKLAIADLESVSERFFFGPATLPDESLPEVPLTQTSYRGAQLPTIGGQLVYTHLYATFPAGSLVAGKYKYRFEQEYAGELFVARGVVTIVSSP